MDRSVLEFLANLHGVQFDSKISDADLEKQLAESVRSAGSPGSNDNGGGETTTPVTPPVTPPVSSGPPALTAPVQQALHKMAEDNEYVKAVLAELSDKTRQIAELQTANRLQEVRRKMSEVGNARRILAPHVSEKLSELVAAMPPKAGNLVIELTKEILSDNGTVELGERGRAAAGSTRDAGTRFNTEVKQLMDADKNLGYADAVTQISAMNPDLFEAYRESATSEYR